MALFPLSSNFEGDFVLQLLPVDTENTMDEVASAAAHHSVGRRVKARPGHILRVRRQGSKEFLPRAMKVEDAGLKPTECVEIIWEPSQP
ncbi:MULTISPECIES: toluene-4-monooxygenase system B family protein [Burkholderiaceae]|uniref:Toluene-4-monooxygenase system protein B n=1 Tax=Caballeronia udeis TaxID=1232866 RepID=A0A158GJA2_9BURK|nr:MULTISPECIES: toluene-4-monooxygenase system B family protein [Burkholderiaceae]MBB5547652.1 toluene monooxygenase system protein B [Paraburkholderia fungorum]CAE6848335.1 Toluene-4-monooxygenase system, hydroxylase component subunit gamma [Paraburkholderia aspalathi]SAL32102.1 Toluene-4-monooxygenase system protein B [Caballeronia udeis]